jgi:HK97 family phage major capsid protein
MKKLITPIAITAADSNSRTITGRIVTFEETGNASIGKVQFAKGSIEAKSVLLNLEHDRTRRIGKTLSIEANEQGIDATFKIANTTAGTDALVEASEGLRDGFSVEVYFDEYETLKDGTVRIIKGEMTGVALTSEPAIRSARVNEVAATTGDEEISDSTIEPDATPTEKDDEVEQTVTPAEAVETVEAAQSVTANAKPAVGGWTSKPRLEFTAAKYLENTIRASMGEESARQYVAAADDTTDNAGLVPTRQLTEVINGLANTTRSSIDAISRGVLPDAGMSFEIPKITVMPTVASTSEAGTPSETDQNSAFVTVNVAKYAGQQTFSVELLDRTSPLFFNELLSNMAAAYAKATDTAVHTAIATGATADGTTLATYPTAAELLGFVSRGAASVYANTNGFARNMIANTSQWANLMTLNDSGRPIYNAAQPSNAGGVVRPDSIRGNVAGLDLYVTANVASANDTDKDDSILIVNPSSYTWYESPTYRLRADVIASGQISVMVYGYGAIATKIGAGAFGINKT